MIRLFAVALLAVSCAPQAPTRARPPATTAAAKTKCTESQTRRQEANQARNEGRFLHAQLLEEHLDPSCVPPLPKEEAPDRARGVSRLEETWRWMGHLGARDALRPGRFSDSKYDLLLDQAARDLIGTSTEPMVLETIPLGCCGAGLTPTGWMLTASNTVARQGEWFERYYLPRPEEDMTLPYTIGPFAERIVVFEQRTVGYQRIAVVFDMLEGVTVARLPLPRTDSGQSHAVGLDDTHFAVRLADLTEMGDKADSGCGLGQETIEIWQAFPAKPVRSFCAPDEQSQILPTVVATPLLPNPEKAAPQAKSQGMSVVPMTLSPEQPQQHNQAEHDISVLSKNLIAVDLGSILSFVDWTNGKVLVAIRRPTGGSGRMDPVLSPSGRYVTFPASFESLGIYEPASGRVRAFRAPSYTTSNVKFSPDERWVATGGSWNLGYLWELESGKLKTTLPSPFPVAPMRHPGNSWTVVGFISEGREVVLSTTYQGDLRSYDVETGRERPLDSSSSLRPNKMAQRADHSVTFWDSEGQASLSVAADGTRQTLPRSEGKWSVEALSSDGDWFLRTSPSGTSEEVVEWVSTDSGRALKSWRAPAERWDYPTISDKYLVGRHGGVRSRHDGEEIWPTRGSQLWGERPALSR
jgi:WD40 repeat protein